MNEATTAWVREELQKIVKRIDDQERSYLGELPAQTKQIRADLVNILARGW